jgi:hypothetical protein
MVAITSIDGIFVVLRATLDAVQLEADKINAMLICSKFAWTTDLAG